MHNSPKQKKTWGCNSSITTLFRTSRVRFSDKVYFGLGLKGAIRIIQKPGQRYLYSGIALTRRKRHKKNLIVGRRSVTASSPI